MANSILLEVVNNALRSVAEQMTMTMVRSAYSTIVKEMMDWNKENGGITTIFIPAKDANISSTLVRERLQNGEDVSELLDSDTKDSLIK